MKIIRFHLSTSIFFTVMLFLWHSSLSLWVVFFVQVGLFVMFLSWNLVTWLIWHCLIWDRWSAVSTDVFPAWPDCVIILVCFVILRSWHCVRISVGCMPRLFVCTWPIIEESLYLLSSTKSTFVLSLPSICRSCFRPLLAFGNCCWCFRWVRPDYPWGLW